jgi:hypothetical protein
MIVIICPGCRALVVFPNHYRGSHSACPSCTRPMAVPDETPESEVQQLLQRYRLPETHEPDLPIKLASDPDRKRPGSEA